MKKILVLLLSLAMVFAFTACGGSEQTEEPAADTGLTAIPLGGNLGEYPLEGDAYGVYNEIEMPEGSFDEGVEGHVYYSEGSDTTYIGVHRWAKDGMTLEEATSAEAEKFGAPGYVMSSWDNMNIDKVGYFNSGSYLGGGEAYYYSDVTVCEDGDDFVSIAFYAATEEVQLGDTDAYVWVPKGSTDLMNDDEKAHGTVFYGEYTDDYYMPIFWIGKSVNSYEESSWWWSEYYEEMPVDKATYDKWVASGWDEKSLQEYYDAYGFKNVKNYVDEVEGYSIFTFTGDVGEYHTTMSIVTVGDEAFLMSTFADLDKNPYPMYGKPLMNSIHKK